MKFKIVRKYYAYEDAIVEATDERAALEMFRHRQHSLNWDFMMTDPETKLESITEIK